MSRDLTLLPSGIEGPAGIALAKAGRERKRTVLQDLRNGQQREARYQADRAARQAARQDDQRTNASTDELEARFLEIDDGLRAQLHALAEHPSAAGAELLAASLNGARQVVLRYRKGLMDQVQAGGR